MVEITLFDVKTTYSYSNPYSKVLTKGQMYRSMEHNREPKQTNTSTPNFDKVAKVIQQRKDSLSK